MSRPLSERMSLQTVAIASFVLVVVLAISLSLAVRAALDETQSLKVIQTRVLASNLTAALAFGDASASRDVLTTLQNDQDVIWARILMPDGQVFAEYRSPDQAIRADFAAPDPTAKFLNETRLRLIQEQVIWRGDSLGQLEVWIDNRAAYDLAQQVLAVALVAVLLGSLLAYVLASRLGGMVLLPVSRLTQLMADITKKEDYSRRFQGSDIKEIQALGDTFNAMLVAVEDRDSSLKQVIVQLEEARDAAQQAAESKTMFLANMSHEIRTPMNGVLGMVSVLKETQIDERQQTYFRTIEQSATDLLMVINDILDFTKLEAGKLQISREVFSLNDTLDVLKTFFAPAAEQKGLEFSISRADDLDDVVEGDPARLRQILINLLGNAFKFTEQGSVQLHVALVASGDSPRTRFTVVDTGVGIAEDKKSGIFSAFFQADFTSTRLHGGTGLGLAICRELATLMGGELGFSSKQGQGSRFWLDVPLPAEIMNPFVSSVAPAAATTSNPFSNAMAIPSESLDRVETDTRIEELSVSEDLRILVAEDSEVNQFIIKELLSTLGCKPLIVDNGEQAVAVFREQGFDLVLMDIQMPVMDGYEATGKIRSLQAEEKINPECQIVGLSAHAMAGDREKSIAAGMDEYLTKPIERARLKDCLTGIRRKNSHEELLWR